MIVVDVRKWCLLLNLPPPPPPYLFITFHFLIAEYYVLTHDRLVTAEWSWEKIAAALKNSQACSDNKSTRQTKGKRSMGYELALACIPAATMTEDRIQHLHALVDGLDASYFDGTNSGQIELERIAETEGVGLRDALHKVVDIVRDAEERWREINHLSFPGLPYTILATGGICWMSDLPTNLYGPFRVIENSPTIWKQLSQWAREDFNKEGTVLNSQ